MSHPIYRVRILFENALTFFPRPSSAADIRKRTFLLPLEFFPYKKMQLRAGTEALFLQQLFDYVSVWSLFPEEFQLVWQVLGQSL